VGYRAAVAVAVVRNEANQLYGDENPPNSANEPEMAEAKRKSHDE